MSRSAAAWNRWLGVGLASCLAVVTLGLAFTGRLALYINPSSNWFAIPMAVLLLAGAAASFLLPLGAEADHGHDHADHEHGRRGRRRADGTHGDDAHADGGHRHGQADRDPARVDPGRAPVALARSAASRAVAVAGGVAASAVSLSFLVLPPAALSAQIAESRDVGAAPLFAGADVVSLATHGDTADFGIGDWASVFATATDPDSFQGDAVTLTGFVTPGEDGAFDLTRLVITHCVIDAQPASVPIRSTAKGPATGTWVEVTGTVTSTASGSLQVTATSVKRIPEPKDPYEY